MREKDRDGRADVTQLCLLVGETEKKRKRISGGGKKKDTQHFLYSSLNATRQSGFGDSD